MTSVIRTIANPSISITIDLTAEELTFLRDFLGRLNTTQVQEIMCLEQRPAHDPTFDLYNIMLEASNRLQVAHKAWS